MQNKNLGTLNQRGPVSGGDLYYLLGISSPGHRNLGLDRCISSSHSLRQHGRERVVAAPEMVV